MSMRPSTRWVSRSLLLTGALLAAALPSPGLSGLEVRVTECDAVAEGSLRIVAEPASESGRRDQAPIEVAAERRFVALDLSDGRWKLRVVSRGVWSEGRTVSLPVERPVELHVWRESRLVGRWSPPKAEEGPNEMIWRLRPVQTRDDLAPPRCPVEELIVSCPVDSEGLYDCPLPAGRWNLRAKADGWAARHFWAVELPPGRKLDLGRLELRRGATLLGEVTTVDGPAHPEATRIELRPLGVPDLDPQATRERRALVLATSLNQQGFFLFEDVLPGLYEVRAHQPGYATARVAPIEVRADLETTILEPLTLAPPIHLTIVIDPPLGAEGEPWRVRLDPAGATTGASAQSLAGDADDEGKWMSPALDPGEFLVSVLDRSGNVLASEGPLGFAGVEEPFLQISLDLTEVAGEVRLGDEPLPAEIWFGGRTGDLRSRVTSDERGRFETVLPRDGTWTLDVFAPAAGVAVRGHSVEVESGEDLLIELPATRLAGSVVDVRGNPVPGADVRIVQIGEGGLFATPSDHDGQFLVRGLSPGTYWLEAVSGDRSSAMLTVAVAEDSPPPPVRLVVEERKNLSGRVISDRGGVAGAAVVALPFLANGALGAPADTVTAVDGGFALALPPATQETLLVVMPLGFGLTVQRVEGVRPLEVRAAAAEGLLRLAPADASGSGEVGVLLIAGEAVDLNILRQWSRLHDEPPSPSGQLTVPALPSGPYSYCTMTVDEAMLVVSGRARPTRCSSGFLPPGGELSLAAP